MKGLVVSIVPKASRLSCPPPAGASELRRFKRKRAPTLAERDRNGKIIDAIRHQQRHRDARDYPVASETDRASGSNGNEAEQERR
jgi:hypothetical protein